MVLAISRSLLLNCWRHSEGRQASCQVSRVDDSIVITVQDDGLGIFERVMQEYRCLSKVEAIGELLKGARVFTSSPSAGLARLVWSVDFATIEANQLRLSLMGRSRDWAISEGRSVRPGTSIALEIREDLLDGLERSIQSIVPPLGRVFLPVAAFQQKASGRILDRRDAKRLLRGVARHPELIVDFRFVETVAHSFVEYLFVDFRAMHPQSSLVPINLNSSIRSMINFVMNPHRSPAKPRRPKLVKRGTHAS